MNPAQWRRVTQKGGRGQTYIWGGMINLKVLFWRKKTGEGCVCWGPYTHGPKGGPEGGAQAPCPDATPLTLHIRTAAAD